MSPATRLIAITACLAPGPLPASVKNINVGAATRSISNIICNIGNATPSAFGREYVLLREYPFFRNIIPMAIPIAKPIILCEILP